MIGDLVEQDGHVVWVGAKKDFWECHEDCLMVLVGCIACALTCVFEIPPKSKYCEHIQKFTTDSWQKIPSQLSLT
jgi:hypothetical protein